MKPAGARTQRGFTLLELSVVLIIIAIVVGMSVSMGVSVISAARLTATQRKMKTIEDALMQFRIADNRLPCPGDITLTPGSANYGVEAANPGTCTGGTPSANHSAARATNTSSTGVEGALPAVTLGLPPDLMVDGWGDKIRYAVDIAYTATGAFTSNGASCSTGAITVNDVNGNARSASSIYALVSHGPNGHGAYPLQASTMASVGSTNANELVNCHCTSTATASSFAPAYVQAQSSIDPTSNTDNFDDLVTYKERWQMRTDWDKTGCTYIYVADYVNNRVEVFTLSGQYVSQFGSSGTGNGQFNGPSDIAVDKSGNVWVPDYNNHRVQEFNSTGSYLGQFGSSGTGNGQFAAGGGPGQQQIDSSGNIWVQDWDNQREEEFGSNLAYESQFGISFYPNCVGFNAGTGDFYITNQTGYYVAEYSSVGAYVTQFGSYGNGNGQFESPNGVAVDAGGNVWVNDAANNNVQEFTGSGSYIRKFGSSGSGNGQFNQPNDMAFDASSNIWVTDPGNNRVQEFNSSGTWLASLGGTSSACTSCLCTSVLSQLNIDI